MTLIETLSRTSGKITKYHFLGDEFKTYLEEGFFAFILCLGGSGTSPMQTQKCLIRGIPAGYYEGGLYSLDRIAIFNNSEMQAIATGIDQIPLVAILLTKSVTSENLSNLFPYLENRQNIEYIPQHNSASDIIRARYSQYR